MRRFLLAVALAAAVDALAWGAEAQGLPWCDEAQSGSSCMIRSIPPAWIAVPRQAAVVSSLLLECPDDTTPSVRAIVANRIVLECRK